MIITQKTLNLMCTEYTSKSSPLNYIIEGLYLNVPIKDLRSLFAFPDSNRIFNHKSKSRKIKITLSKIPLKGKNCHQYQIRTPPDNRPSCKIYLVKQNQIIQTPILTMTYSLRSKDNLAFVISDFFKPFPFRRYCKMWIKLESEKMSLKEWKQKVILLTLKKDNCI